MVEYFLSKYGLKSLKTGSPVLSLFEAIAQSQLRTSDDIFSTLRGIALEFATGQSLDRLGLDELTPRLVAKTASGYTTWGDSSFTKISTVIFQGSGPVIVGSSSIAVSDATDFPTVGTQYVYLGRGTSNYEGPLEISSIDNPGVTGGNYWRINLVGSTTRYHAPGESVILAQGGNRTIASGQLVQTAQGALSAPLRFRVVYTATIPDGEDTLENVLVTAVQTGLSGNVIKEGINTVVSPPYAGATVFNPSPFTNGRNLERDEDYKERIKLRRRSRTLGTATALKTYALGVEAPDENATVTSTSLVTKEGEPAVLYIDDGTGYEERHSGVAEEVLIDLASGGEQYFRVSQVPISKAVSLTSLSAPYVLRAGKLAFSVGGVVTEHTFDASSFSSISSASANEVCSSINSNAGLNWSARTYDGGSKIAVYAKSDTNDDVQLSTASSDDVNDVLGFGSERVLTTSLYKNDLLLSKDGLAATVYSRPFSEWQSLASPQGLSLSVDGVQMDYTYVSGTPTVGQHTAFTDQDFIDAETGYSTLGKNSLAAWAKVLNYRIPGITATVVGNRLAITSNRGKSDSASVQTLSGTLVTNSVFYEQASSLSSSIGKNSDYTINRNTGEIRLQTPLIAGDKLSLGTSYTRAFLQTPDVLSTVLSADANMWFVVDGQAEVVAIGEMLGQAYTLTKTATAWGALQALTNSRLAANAEVGDWLIVWDSSPNALGVSGAYRISRVTGTDVEFEVDGTTSNGSGTFAEGGIALVRTSQQVQKLTLARLTGGTPNTYTATSLANLIDLRGATASVYRTNKVRIATNSFGDVRDIALVAQDQAAEDFGLSSSSYTDNLQGHLGSIETSNGQVGTPVFQSLNVSTAGATTIDVDNWSSSGIFTDPPSHYSAMGLFSPSYSLARPRFGSNKGFVSSLSDTTPGAPDTLVLRNTAAQDWLETTQLALLSPYCLSWNDQLNLIVDQDTTYGRFAIPFARKVTPTTSTYGATNAFTDADNGGVSLARAFGYGSNVFDWGDFAVWMSPRVLITQDANILWRYYRPGPDGNNMTLRYALPANPDLTPALESDPTAGADTELRVVLGSGNLRSGYTLPANYPMGVVAPSTDAGSMTSVYYMTGLKVISYQRTTNVATVRFEFPSADVTESGLDNNPVKLYAFSTLSAAPSGTWDFSAVTLSEWVPASGVYDKAVFADVGVDVPLTAGNVGVMYFSPTATASFLGGSPAVAQGDYLRAEAASGLPADFTGFTASIQNVPGTDLYHLKVLVPSLAVNTVIQYANVVDTSQFKIFANAGSTANSIVSSINALGGFVSGTVISGGTNVITESTEEAQDNISPIPTLKDGINYVQSTTSPVLISDNYTFTFKDGITAALATGTDWLNEDVYLVPTTPKNVVDWMNILGVTGLSQVAEIVASDAGKRVQISSLTTGSGGSIQAIGGKANSATASVVGSSQTVGSQILATVRSSDVTGMFAGCWVSVDNALGLDKTGSIFNGSSKIETLSSTGTITFGAATSLYTEIVASSKTNLAVSIQKVDDFVLISDSGLGANTIVGALGGVSENDYVQIKTVTASQSGTDVNELNMGLFKVVRVDSTNGLVWIENSTAVDQNLCDVDLRFFDESSIMPGDTFRIDTPFYGVSNIGSWLITEVGNDFTDDSVMTVSISDKSITDTTSGVALGSDYVYLRFTGAPYRGIKQIYSISPYDSDASLSYIKLSGTAGQSSIGAAGETVLTVLDKLSFPLTLNAGLDGYSYSTGLIREVNKVIYGDLSSPSVYPGVAAANSKINIEGPLVKKIKMGFQARIFKGFSKSVVAEKIKNAAAGAINSYGVGQSISVSDVIKKVQQIGGLRSVVVLSPVYNSANDLISVQPFERAMVLNPSLDISVVFVGE